MNRRGFAFLIGMGLFWVSDKLRADRIDEFAATLMKSTERVSTRERWAHKENRRWRWFERETYLKNQWKLTGVTTPINKETGEPYTGRTGYLDESLVPRELRNEHRVVVQKPVVAEVESTVADGQPDPAHRALEGRPPSQWLRSLEAAEIRIWLKTIEVPEFGVSGMTFWTHLTRDHFFDPKKIEGLTVDEQAKLHATAHYGY